MGTLFFLYSTKKRQFHYNIPNLRRDNTFEVYYYKSHFLNANHLAHSQSIQLITGNNTAQSDKVRHDLKTGTIYYVSLQVNRAWIIFSTVIKPFFWQSFDSNLEQQQKKVPTKCLLRTKKCFWPWEGSIANHNNLTVFRCLHVGDRFLRMDTVSIHLFPFDADFANSQHWFTGANDCEAYKCTSLISFTCQQCVESWSLIRCFYAFYLYTCAQNMLNCVRIIKYDSCNRWSVRAFLSH